MGAMAKDKDTDTAAETVAEAAAEPAPAAPDLRRADGPDAVLTYAETFEEVINEETGASITSSRERVLRAEELEPGYWFYRPETPQDVAILDGMDAQVARKAMGQEEDAPAASQAGGSSEGDKAGEDASSPSTG